MDDCNIVFYKDGNLQKWDRKRPKVNCGFMFWKEESLIVITPRGSEEQSNRGVLDRFDLKDVWPTALGVMTSDEIRIVSFKELESQTVITDTIMEALEV